MSQWQRVRVAMAAGVCLASLVLGLVFCVTGQPYQRQLLRPIVVGGGLLLVFGPVLVGNYLAGRKGRPPLS